MTMTIEMTAAVLLPDGARCRAARHASTNTAWREGCRHPAAVEAHRQWLVVNGGDRDKMLPPQLDAGGNCIAEKHDSCRAYRRGCRCKRAIKLWEENHERRRADPARVRREIEYATEWGREMARNLRRTGGRYAIDPRRQWRGGKMAVSRIGLLMMLSGYPDSPTRGERLAAAIRLQSTMTRTYWYERPRPIYQSEIADRIGCTDQTVGRLLNGVRPELAASRAQRRLADVQWKAAVAAEAPARRERERALHAAAQQRREAWKQHCRTMRQLRESQA
jgi:hypothetical protein